MPVACEFMELCYVHSPYMQIAETDKIFTSGACPGLAISLIIIIFFVVVVLLLVLLLFLGRARSWDMPF